METAITESFTKSVQAAVDQCMEKVREESRIFANALAAVRHLPTPIHLPVASPIPVPVPVVPDSSHLEHRLAALELAYQRQVQKTIAGLSEDIGDLDGRLAAIERTNREEDVGTWKPTQGSWSWPGPSMKNEVVVVDDATTVCDFGLGSDVRVNVHHIDDEDVEMLPAETKVVAAAPAPVAATAQAVAPAPAPVAAPAAEEPEAEEDEEAPLELEEFDHDGESYYKDPDNNVYKPNADGEVDADAPIGRWLTKQKIIKMY